MTKRLVEVKVVVEVAEDLDIDLIEVNQDPVVDGIVIYREGEDNTEHFQIHDIKEVSKGVVAQ